MGLLHRVAGRQLATAAKSITDGRTRYVCVALASAGPYSLLTALFLLPLSFYASHKLQASINAEINNHNTLDEYLIDEYGEDPRAADLIWGAGSTRRLIDFRLHWIELTQQRMKTSTGPLSMVPVKEALESYLSKLRQRK